ncbi:MAG TPA: nuclear transport factor 2 family protein [Thermomonospora sp.]|nr:nuclear transport factor 2 family protein [Thermomonospora sp.]
MDYTDVAERYLAAWNAADDERRAKAVADAWTEDGGYTDPLGEVSGHEAITAMIGAVREQFPGHAFRLGGPVDGHHDTARFTWELAPEGAAEATVVGFDVVALAGDGRIRQVYGFLDKVPGA